LSTLLERIRAVGIVPVVKLTRASDARSLGQALRKGGLPVAEITFRTAAAPDAIRILRAEFPDLLVGAGTVLTPAQADAALEAGAAFAVAPGLNPRVVDHCLSKGLPIVPGVNNPSQLEQGLERGLSFLKFFPAEASGGVKMLKALHGPYADVTFMPTGGVEPANLGTYLALPYVVAVGGSWMVKEALLEAGKVDELAALCAEAVRLAASLRAAK
jgi:2-dehydro-3-deoxyphosphogluconate aldolase / (4S)-4-hydroxy-2-oxoglutarate aldolase